MLKAAAIIKHNPRRDEFELELRVAAAKKKENAVNRKDEKDTQQPTEKQKKTYNIRTVVCVEEENANTH